MNKSRTKRIFRNWKSNYNEILSRYKDGESPADIAKSFNTNRTIIRGIIARKIGLRSQSEAAILAVQKGKKEKSIKALIQAATTVNRFHPMKHIINSKIKRNCRKCNNIFYINSPRQKWCLTCVPGRKERSIMLRYGLSANEHNTLLEKSCGKCSICKKKRDLIVDHDHKTGFVRGLICNGCNLALHYFEQGIWKKNASYYLEQFN